MYTAFRRPGTIACLVLLTLLSLVLSGYRFGVSDHAYKIPFLKATLSPELYPGDETVAQRHNYVSFTYHVVGPLVRVVGIEWAYFVLHVACLGLFLASVYVLARGLSGRDSVGLLAAAMMVLPKSLLGGIDSFDTVFLAREMAYAPAVLSVHLLLKRRYAASLFVAGLVLNLHAATALPLVAVLVFTAALWRPLRVKRLATGLVLLALAGAPFVVARLGSEAPTALQVLDPEWLGLLRMRMPHHYFASTWRWHYSVFLPLAAFGLYALWAVRRSRTDTGVVLMVMASALACFGGWFFTEVIPVQAVMIATPFRSTLVVLVLAVAVIARMLVARVGVNGLSVVFGSGIVACVATGHSHLLVVPAAGWVAVEHLMPRVRNRVLAWGLLAAGIAAGGAVFLKVQLYFHSADLRWLVGQAHYVLLWASITVAALGVAGRRVEPRTAHGWHSLAGAAVLGMVAFFVISEAALGDHRLSRCAWPWVVTDSPWQQVQCWAKHHTPLDARFITPPRRDGFRIHSERGVVVEWKDGAFINFSRRAATTWHRRMVDLGAGTDKNTAGYGQLDEKALAALSAKYGAHYVVVERPKALRLPLAYENDAFRVYRLQGSLQASDFRPQGEVPERSPLKPGA